MNQLSILMYGMGTGCLQLFIPTEQKMKSKMDLHCSEVHKNGVGEQIYDNYCNVLPFIKTIK